VTGSALDLIAAFEPQAGGSCGITIACSADGKERIDIMYETVHQRLVTRKIAPDAGGSLVTHLREVPHELTADELLTLRILLDGSVVEVIANDRTSVTSRIYTSRANSQHVRLLGTKARVQSLDIWEMPSIWR
jgi:beta-fructofuranosidase